MFGFVVYVVVWCVFFFNIYIVLGARGCFFEDSSALTYSKAKCIYKKQMIDSLLNDT